MKQQLTRKERKFYEVCWKELMKVYNQTGDVVYLERAYELYRLVRG